MSGRDHIGPVLSLILCSRNDEYMGNSRWRLQTTLNYVADQVAALDRVEDVEVIVADWGSEVPLSETLNLTPQAAVIVSFLHVPPESARQLQKDSPFPEVLALNAAARRARGLYIGRIDQDTLVGRTFLKTFLNAGERLADTSPESAVFFSNIRLVPYRFSVRCPQLRDVAKYVDRFGRWLRVELGSSKPFYNYSVGIWLLPKRIWDECGGYDETMLYMNRMEIDMICRLTQKYPLIDLGKIVGYDFYHLEHYHPWEPRRSSTYRKENRRASPERLLLHPNDEAWGLEQYKLDMTSASPVEPSTSSRRRDISDRARFPLLLLLSGTQIAVDTVVLRVRAGRHWYSRRVGAIRETISGQPVGSWYRLLRERWHAHREDRGRAAG